MSGHHHPSEGRPTSLTTKAMEMTSNIIQNFTPVNQVDMHFCGFHFYSGNINRPVESQHYCSHLNEEVSQCLIYDSVEKNARLIGVEYIISRRLYETLDPQEQKLWHSHAYEVKAGMLVAPRLPMIAENALMNGLIDTYGKTIHTWQVDRGDVLPIGPPQLMMAFTKDGQMENSYLQKRDARFGVDTSEKKAARESLPTPIIHSNANSWEKGETYQLEVKRLEQSSH